MPFSIGSFGSCTDPTLATKEACSAAAGVDDQGGAAWLNPQVGSFDSFGDAMRLLYSMSTTDEWELSMFRMMDATLPGQAPLRSDFNLLAALFSITWMLVGSLFALNLFVGVVLDNFGRIKAQTEGSATMTPQQQQWVATMMAAHRQKPIKEMRVPRNCLRQE